MRRFVVAGVAMIAATLGTSMLAGCGADPDDGSRAAETSSTVPIATVVASDETFPANGVTESVLVIDNNFMPQTLSIAAGTEVVFENKGRNDHDVIPVGDLEALTWGVQAEQFAPKSTYSHVFAQPGTYAYFCTIHGTATAGMVGTIVVTTP